MNPFDSVRNFEQAIADFAGAPYGVAVETCTAALLLSCAYKQVKEVEIPKYTYVSVPCSIIHAGGKVKFRDEDWKGIYELKPYKIIDGALRFKKGMYKSGTLHCLSFHFKKLLPLGRGGMILTDDKRAVDWLRKARFDGRTEGVSTLEDNFEIVGWNFYMYPEIASRGLHVFSFIKDKELDDIDPKTQGYPDLSQFPIFTK